VIVTPILEEEEEGGEVESGFKAKASIVNSGGKLEQKNGEEETSNARGESRG